MRRTNEQIDVRPSQDNRCLLAGAATSWGLAAQAKGLEAYHCTWDL